LGESDELKVKTYNIIFLEKESNGSIPIAKIIYIINMNTFN